MDIDRLLSSLETEDLVGQVLCYDINDGDDPGRVEEILRKIRPGGIFLMEMSAEKIKMYTEMANKYTRLPVVVAADVENGPGSVIRGAGTLPQQMAWGACDDPELIERAGEETARLCRRAGIHWTFSPVVDINYNHRNPEINIRAISDRPEQVAKIASAFVRGVQKNGYMAATCKHFPGQGIDDRNSHFCTPINPLSREEWQESFGYVYREMIKAGTRSVMISHTCLPSCEEDIDPFFGAPPAVLSKSLMTDLLKGELGFEGVVVSDAMSMIGVASRVDRLEDIAVRFLAAGGDMVLFPEPTDYDNILAALKDGSLSEERLRDAVARILRMKAELRLFEDARAVETEIGEKNGLGPIAEEIADRSVRIIRDVNGILPVSLPRGAKILMLNIVDKRVGKFNELAPMRAALEERGYVVEEIYGAKHGQVAKCIGDCDMVLINCKISSLDYHGATLRVGWDNVMVMWRGYALQHKRVIFTSFGDPYKLYDMPYLKEYINAHSNTPESQRAVVRLILGEIPDRAKNPVDFPPFFRREV